MIGVQTGDEGKGVRGAYYVKRAVKLAIDGLNSLDSGKNLPLVWTLRWQGGGNAGHTVEIEGKTRKLHQIPSGILIPKAYNLMGEGVFYNPREGMQEILNLQSDGVDISQRNFGIASNAHVTLDYHVDEDQGDRQKKEHTSTGRGIRPTAVDKFGRTGLRFEEFLDRQTFIEVLRDKRFPKNFPTSFGSIENFVDSYEKEREFLAQFSVLQSDILNSKDFTYGIGEGAQGFKLDVDKGLYSGITSSNPAIVPFRVDTVWGVIKMYESSVGHDRPFVGQMHTELESVARERWNEFGTTTKLPRDLGWIDIVALRHAINSCGIDYLIGTCGDRLELMSELSQPVRLVVAYDLDGKKYSDWDKSFHNRRTLYRATPVFEEFEPWKVFFDKEKGKLSPNAQIYVDRIQELTGKEFALHGYGPGIDDVYEVKDALAAA
mgnify:FL=1